MDRLAVRCAPGLRLVALAAALVALAASPPPAHAAFPGADGLIAAEAPGGGAQPIVLRREDGLVERLLPAGRDPAFSPRGRRLAFAAGGDLWVVDADGARLRRLTGGPGRDGRPAWSPGGDAVVFASGPAGRRDLYRVRSDGTARQQLTFRGADDTDPAWSSADQIAFVRRPASGPSRGGPAGATTGPRRGRIYVLTPASFTVQAVSPPGADDGAPAWSPDGTQLAFTRRSGDRRAVFVKRPGGPRARRLTPWTWNADAPAWSPDGRRLLVTAAGTRPGRRLLVIGANRRPRELSPLSRTERVLGRAGAGPRAADWQPAGLDPVIAAAGDIACDPADGAFAGGLGTVDRCRQLATSNLLLTMDLDAVLVLGDTQYDNATLATLGASFGPSWGRLTSLLHPVLGNHDFGTPGAADYFTYFNAGQPVGPAGETGRGWYSFDVGAWHLIALNSQCGLPGERPEGPECAAGSSQEQWLRADLAAHPAPCTLAFFHHPRFSGGTLGPDDVVLPFWQALYDGNADLILNGHDHAYERFAPQDPGGNVDPVRGIREFIAGTGGHSHQKSVLPEPNSEQRDARDFGVLRLTLHPTTYDWAFVTEGGVIADAGSGACH